MPGRIQAVGLAMLASAVIATPTLAQVSFANRRDSLEWAKHKAVAQRSTGLRAIVSLKENRLWVVSESDTLLNATVAVARGNTLSYEGMEKTFTTPRGVRRILAKSADPIWNPPDW